MTDLSLTVQKLIPAPVEKVYNAWLDPKALMRFMAPGPAMTVPRAETDPKVGGRFEVVMRMGTNDLLHAGTYLELVPHSKIVFSWESPHSIEGSTVTLDLAPEGDGTMLTLTHVRFANEGSRDNHRSGWTAILAALAADF
ncbi:MAG: SRPBCC family protein [Cypionkella sp.]